MTAWFWYAVGAAVLYGAHQIFKEPASVLRLLGIVFALAGLLLVRSPVEK